MNKILLTGILLVEFGIAFTQPAIRLYNKGVRQAEKGNYETAKRFFTKALEQDHIMSSAYYNRGLSKSNLKEYESALA